MKARLNPNVLTKFSDPAFPKTTIQSFAAAQLAIPEEQVMSALWSALAADKQTEANRQMLEKAMKQTVNASGAIILIINTNNGPQLIYGESQRRKKVVCSNGACEPGESISATAIREFREESGHPAENGILSSIVNNSNNCRSLEMTNQIGRNAEEIANRIINKKALYLNVSSLYVNTDPVNINHLQLELAELNKKLAAAAPFYQPAVLLLFGDREAGIKPADLTDPAVQAKARELIADFNSACSQNITENFALIIGTDKPIKPALEAIVDLSENKEMGLIPKEKLISLLSLDFKNSETVSAFKKDFFMPSFENIIPHMGERKPAVFLSDLENISFKTSHINLGFAATDGKKHDSELASAEKDLGSKLTK